MTTGMRRALRAFSFAIFRQEAITLMYQTGYLTIKDYDKVFDSYYLDYPNDEVKNGFEQIFRLGINFSSQTRTFDGWNMK